MSLEDRVGRLETEQVRQGEQLGRMTAEVGHVRDDVGRVARGIDQLLEREQKRPSSLTFQTVAITCGALMSIGGVVWWLIGASPAVQELRERMGRLDDPTVGRVPALEKRLDTLSGWGAQVTKGR